MILPDADTCYRAVSARDPRFDGWFFTAVRTTGIYCRPSCPALTPAASQRQLLPDRRRGPARRLPRLQALPPGRRRPARPSGTSAADLVARAMRLIADGVVDRDGVPGLAAPARLLRAAAQPQLLAELGAGPLALARAQRAQTARLLLETTDLPIADVAFAAGFASVRQFNDTVREVFATTPDRPAQPIAAQAERREPAASTAAPALPPADRT